MDDAEDEVSKQNLDWLRLATEGSQLGLWLWDEVKQELSWDARTREMFGTPPEGEVTLETFYGALHADDRERVVRDWRSAFDSGMPFSSEYRTRRPDGSVRWVDSRGRGYRDASGKPTRMVGVLFDITERKKTDEILQEYKEHLELLVQQRTAELVEARDQAEAANRAKGVFLANMSHELRTPLNAILGFSNLLREHSASPAQRQDLDIIKRSGEHLLRLINDVLDVAKIEAGRTELEMEDCDLQRLVRDVTEMVRPQARLKCLEMRVESLADRLFIRTDTARLRQVLINLLSNAVKFTHRGSITLRVKGIPTDDPGKVQITFEIEDTGRGIAAGDQAAIFEAFVQTGVANGRDGAGLGLTISRQIIELMGGTISVESSPGHGSVFRTEITAERASGRAIDEGPELESGTVLSEGQPDWRVLIVEDEPENWMVLERLLLNAGSQVRVATNGAEGVDEFCEWHPHFIWMDLRMPVMDGLEATRSIRRCGGGREVKIVALTASGYASERRDVLAQGLDDYVRKPYRPTEIFQCMARHLGVRYRVSDTSTEPNNQQAGELTREAISHLPEELCENLRQALMTLRPEQISAAIQRIYDEDAQLGLLLSSHADRFAYSKILDVVDKLA